MANTKLKTILYGNGSTKYTWICYRLISDGTQETNAIVFNNATDGPANVKSGTVERIFVSGKSTACLARLEWDQTTASPINSFTPAYNNELSFEEFGGIKNPGAAGATGNIVLTTLALAAGDEFTLYMKVKNY